MSTALTLTDQKTMAQTFAMSKLFKHGSPAEMFVKIQAGQELGIAPFASVAAIHVIDGKPILSATLQAALIRKSGEYDYEIATLTAEKCELVITRKGKIIGRSIFTEKDAKEAGLLDGKNKHSWKNYRRNMLFSRAISNALRWYCPDLGAGTTWYAPEELGGPEVIDGEVIDTTAQESGGPEVIEGRVADLTRLIQSTGANVESILAYYGASDLVAIATEEDTYDDLFSKLQLKEKATNGQAERGVLQGDGLEVGDRGGREEPGQAVLATDV